MRTRVPPVALLFTLLPAAAGCFRMTGYCDTAADCQSGEICSASYRCVAQDGIPDQGPGDGPSAQCPGEDSLRGQGYLWSRTFGGKTMNRAWSADPGACGSVAVAGYFGGLTDFGGGPRSSIGISDAFVALYDRDGGHLWSRTMGGTGASASCVDVATYGDGGVVVTGSFNNTTDFGGGPVPRVGAFDSFVARYGGPQRGLLWLAHLFGDGGVVESNTVAIDGGGDVLVAGSFIGTVNLGGGDLRSAGLRDIFLAKLRGADGHHVWSRRFGGEKDDAALAMAVASDGSILLGGTFVGPTDLGRGALPGAGGVDGFVAKYGAGGEPLWSKSLGGGREDQVVAVALHPGGAAVAGTFQGMATFGGQARTAAGATDAFVARIDAAGDVAWVGTMGGQGPDVTTARAVGVDPRGDVLTSGSFQRTVNLGGGPLSAMSATDIFVARYAGADGAHVYSRGYGSPEVLTSSTGQALAVDPRSGEATITGNFQGAVDFGEGPKPSQSSSAVFVLRHGLRKN